MLKPIEKEIETEHKIIFQFTLRQGLSGLGVILTFIFFYSLTDEVIPSIICELPFLTIFFFTGWFKRRGLYIEDILIRKLQTQFYKNSVRKYRTRNSYYRLFNTAYEKKYREEQRSKNAKPKAGKKEKGKGGK